MGRWVAFQLRARNGREQRIDAATVRDLQSPHWTFASGSGYGRGWFVERLDGVGEVVSVGGEVDGYTSEIAFAPERAVGVIVMANRGDATGVPDLTRWLLARMTGEGGAAEAQVRRGLLHQAAREWAVAFEAFEALAERDPTNGRALYQIGRTGALSGLHPNAAAEALERYLERSPAPGDVSHAAARWRLGMIHQRAGRCAEAERQYALALSADAGLESAVAHDRQAIGGCGSP
jgi:tetratricopeptide (TPR) repeat protein